MYGTDDILAKSIFLRKEWMVPTVVGHSTRVNTLGVLASCCDRFSISHSCRLETLSAFRWITHCDFFSVANQFECTSSRGDPLKPYDRLTLRSEEPAFEVPCVALWWRKRNSTYTPLFLACAQVRVSFTTCAISFLHGNKNTSIRGSISCLRT